MRAHEVLFESDSRTRVEKLLDVINHPATEETIRAVARAKLQQLMGSEPIPQKRIISVPVNVEESDFDRQFVLGVTIGEIYDALCALAPKPSNIAFLRQGQIQMLVPPPFHGLTKMQYYEIIMRALPGVRNITSGYASEGYYFTLSYI